VDVSLDDPLDRVFALGVPDRHRAIALALAAALVAHGGMAGAIRLRGEVLRREAPLLGAQEVVIEREVPPPPAPPEPEPPPSPPPQPPKVNPNVTAPAPDPSEQPDEKPAAEAAQAGEILLQESDEEEEEEDTDDADENTFVTGDAGTYAGGMTAGTGTSALAVHGSVVATGGVLGGIGTAAMAPKPATRDRSREAWLDVTSWDDCDFPGEADRHNIRNAIVEMKVTVRPNGTAHAVTIVDDPGFGFARTASACALKHKFAPAHDREGNNIWGTTRPFHVGFHR
jgi:hypothetical protein